MSHPSQKQGSLPLVPREKTGRKPGEKPRAAHMPDPEWDEAAMTPRPWLVIPEWLRLPLVDC